MIAQETPTCLLRLITDAAATRSLRETIQAYEWLMDFLGSSMPAEAPSDVVALHRHYYEIARTRTALPAQLVTLGFRDFIARRRGEPLAGLPLDAKLFNIKTVAIASVATVAGRITVPFKVMGYANIMLGSFPARLVDAESHFELRTAIGSTIDIAPNPEDKMTTDTVATRIGRVIAGMAHAAVDGAESMQPIAVLQQAIREIDAAGEDVRLEAGKAMAERHRLTARRDELSAELRELDEKVRLALSKDEDSLAQAGIERQLDIEAQTKVLDRLVAEVDQRIAAASESLDAINASRREAESRLADFQRSQTASSGGSMASGSSSLEKANARVRRAQAAAGRISGIPIGDLPARGEAIDRLNALARDHAVQDRLARLKSNLA